MHEPIETVIVRGQQKLDLNDILNPIEIEVKDDRILNTLKKRKNVYDRLTPISILFPPPVTNDTRQILVALINGKIYNILVIISLDKISNWEYIKGKSLWVNASFSKQEQINDSKHLSFSFKTLSLNDLLNFRANKVSATNKGRTNKFPAGGYSKRHSRIQKISNWQI